MDKKIFDIIKNYVDLEENKLNIELKPKTHKKCSINDISLDEIFWWWDNSSNSTIGGENDENSWVEREFWKEHKDYFYDLLIKNQISKDDFWLLKDAINIVRWKYYVNDNYESIDWDFQDMCVFIISLQLQNNDIWISNFLWYFNPDSSYYKRIQSLTLFRLLEKPKEQIESVRDEVCELLYESTQLEDWSYKKAENILKEYIERVFTITRTTYDSRVEFISEWGDNRDIRCWNNDFLDWLRAYINWEEFDANNSSSEEGSHDNEEIKNLKTKQKELLDKLKKAQALYNENLREKEIENAELRVKISLLQHASEISKKTEKKEETKQYSESLEEKRKNYRILVVWWREHVNKKYNDLLRNWFKWKLYDKFKITPKQLWELYGNYNKQKTQKNFAKKIENDLLRWSINFVLALQTDHETWFYKLLNNSEFLSRITYFAEREDNNQNPKYSDQAFSEERFYYYLGRAIEKYERANENAL